MEICVHDCQRTHQEQCLKIKKVRRRRLAGLVSAVGEVVETNATEAKEDAGEGLVERLITSAEQL